ncbi:MAG: hypothetical protein IPG76_15820 [Acidobacteria bacterium]|nr:hypothetical protein [Acidobacteriota bacterium]
MVEIGAGAQAGRLRSRSYFDSVISDNLPKDEFANSIKDLSKREIIENPTVFWTESRKISRLLIARIPSRQNQTGNSQEM